MLALANIVETDETEFVHIVRKLIKMMHHNLNTLRINGIFFFLHLNAAIIEINAWTPQEGAELTIDWRLHDWRRFFHLTDVHIRPKRISKMLRKL